MVMIELRAKFPNDYDKQNHMSIIHELMEQYQLNIPISYMQADVCREELLIEIEGIAEGNRSILS